jgi:hypothetical protein
MSYDNPPPPPPPMLPEAESHGRIRIESTEAEKPTFSVHMNS